MTKKTVSARSPLCSHPPIKKVCPHLALGEATTKNKSTCVHTQVTILAHPQYSVPLAVKLAFTRL